MEKFHPSIVANIASAEKYLPIFILCQDTMDSTASIHATTCMNKRLDVSLLVSTFPNFTYPYLCFNILEQRLLDEITANILCVDVINSADDIKVVIDMRVLNSYENRKGRMFGIFWKSAS